MVNGINTVVRGYPLNLTLSKENVARNRTAMNDCACEVR